MELPQPPSTRPLLPQQQLRSTLPLLTATPPLMRDPEMTTTTVQAMTTTTARDLLPLTPTVPLQRSLMELLLRLRIPTELPPPTRRERLDVDVEDSETTDRPQGGQPTGTGPPPGVPQPTGDPLPGGQPRLPELAGSSDRRQQPTGGSQQGEAGGSRPDVSRTRLLDVDVV